MDSSARPLGARLLIALFIRHRRRSNLQRSVRVENFGRADGRLLERIGGRRIAAAMAPVHRRAQPVFRDAIANCVASGVRQVVVLGAGLDTFSLRNPFVDLGVRVFEVDYVATQMWKRERIKAAGLIEPQSLIFAPIDFERESLSEGLIRVGFRLEQPAFFQWLGVVPYLTKEAISSTLKFISKIPQAVVVFDYAEPFQNYPAERQANVIATAERAAARGEPWLSLFDPAELFELLRGEDFKIVEDLGLPEIAERLYGALRRDLAIGPGPHIVRALQ